MSIFAAFVLALLIALIISPAYRGRGNAAIGSLVVFFFILFMAGVASQFWIIPFGPVLWGIAWLPLLFIILIFAFLFAAPSPYQRSTTRTGEKAEEISTAGEAISIFIWLLLSLLLIAIIIGYYRTPLT
jgi:hypothetical protein